MEAPRARVKPVDTAYISFLLLRNITAHLAVQNNTSVLSHGFCEESGYRIAVSPGQDLTLRKSRCQLGLQSHMCPSESSSKLSEASV